MIQGVIEALKIEMKLLCGIGFRKAYGQFAEDIIAQKLLKTITHDEKSIFYIDVGSHHPVFLSNTYALYKQGGRGIAVDANPAFAKLFKVLRPRDTFINCGVGNEGSATFYLFEQPAHNTFVVEEAEKKKKQGIRSVGTVTMPTKSLTHIIKEYDVRKIDFLNIDIEGQEIEVLGAYDWAVPPSVICVESKNFDPSNPITDDTYRLLVEKGYVLRSYLGQCLFFVRNGKRTVASK